MKQIQEAVQATERLLFGESLAIALGKDQKEQKETWQFAADEIPEYAKAIMEIQSLIAKTQEADPTLVNTYDTVWLEVEDAKATTLLTRVLVGMNLNAAGSLEYGFDPFAAKEVLVEKLGFKDDADPLLRDIKTTGVIEKLLLMFAGETLSES